MLNFIMVISRTRLFAVAITSLFLSGCADTTFVAEQQSDVKKLVVLHTNDHHGRFWHNDKGEYGMAARKTLLDKLRAQAQAKGQQVILLSGGDINTGVPESDMQMAEPDFKGMSLLGYDAMAIGNHEFDNPISVLAKQHEWANFPLLSANIIDKETGDYAYQATSIIQKGDISIALVGLTTTDTQVIGNPEYISHLSFTNPVIATKKALSEIRAKANPDITIAVTHMGHFSDAKHGINAPGDVTLARGMAQGELDVIIGGHSQEPVCMAQENQAVSDYQPGDSCTPDKQNGTWIMQAHEWGKYVGKAEFEITKQDVKLVSYQLIPVNLIDASAKQSDDKQEKFVGGELEKDASIYQFLLPYQQKGEGQILTPIGSINGKLQGDRSVVRYQQTNLGRLIAAAQMAKVNADFGIISSGGIRNSIDAGGVNYKQVLSVHPFKNRIIYVDMSGKEVAQYLATIAKFPPDSGAYTQFYGVSLHVENGHVSDIRIQGQAIKPNKQYRFSINSYNAAGGDGYPKLLNHPGYVATNYIDAEVLKEFISENSPIDVSFYAPTGQISYH